jgi:hypothetical protein
MSGRRYLLIVPRTWDERCKLTGRGREFGEFVDRFGLGA